MKIRTPFYYKDFKCIAGACTDTCCAGWDVDVDEKSYKYYSGIKGEFGKRLKKVMVPSEEGGCTFTLNEGRCPFLNNKNLCDLFVELGEDKLCETCAEFPRFTNEYGGIREIGIAPSCKTAGELMFTFRDKLTFTIEESDELPATYNDIDPQLFVMLSAARECAYSIVQLDELTIKERCALLLEMAVKIQKKMDADRDDLIANVISQFGDDEYCFNLLGKKRKEYAGQNKAEELLPEYFASFKGMEVINPDWNKYVEDVRSFFETIGKKGTDTNWEELEKKFDEYYKDRQFEYEQLLMYYLFRYFLDAVYDINIMLKVKNAVIGYLVLKTMDVAAWYKNGLELGLTEQVDMAHLYSRQFEHSYYNFQVYSEHFQSKRKYSYANLMRLLLN